VDYTKNERWFPRLVRAFLGIIPLVTLVLLFSGRWFNLYYTSVHPYADHSGPLVIARGAWYLPQMIYTYGLIVLGFGLLLWHMLRLRALYRRQIAFVLLGMIVPVLVNIFYQTGAKLIPALYVPIDLTPISFTISAALVSIGVFGLRMFDLIPIARSVVMENIPEMVIVVDAFNRVLDVNLAAQNWVKKPEREIIGQDVSKVFSLWGGLGAYIANTRDVVQEIEVPGIPPRTLELMVSPINNSMGNPEGRVIVAHDISGRKNMENELKRANRALRVQIAEVESLRAKLHEQAIRDPLTGLFNRRHLADALDREVIRAQQENGTFSVIVIDLDHFKHFNDEYGHKCGDIVLLTMARLFSSAMRPEDVLCRYGGEEFVLLLPGMTAEAAVQQAEGLRQMLKGKSVEHNGQTIALATLSAGVACYPLHGADSDTLLSAADQALYQSKNNGRDQITVFSKP
jgi:diguanylate cyclase (GGDEF)-like protein/PAS domain S-box-containing protein